MILTLAISAKSESVMKLCSFSHESPFEPEVGKAFLSYCLKFIACSAFFQPASFGAYLFQPFLNFLSYGAARFLCVVVPFLAMRLKAVVNSCINFGSTFSSGYIFLYSTIVCDLT